MAQIQTLLNRIDFGRLLVMVGFDGVDTTAEKYQGFCLFHNDVSTKSFTANLDKKIFRCFGCNFSGTAIDLYARWKKIPYEQAVGELNNFDAVKLSLDTPDPALERKSSKSSIPVWRKREILNSFVKSLPFVTQTPHADYMIKERGIPAQILDAYGVRGLVRGYSWDSPYSTEELLNVGILDLYNDSPRLRFSHHPILFPYYDGDDVVYVQGRVVGEPKSDEIKYHGTNKPIPVAFNHWVLGAEEGEIHVTEGVLDALSLIVMGYKSTIGIVGVNGFKEEWLRDMRSRKVVLAFDNDKTGNDAYEPLAKMFFLAGFSVRRFDLPKQYKDINKMLTNSVLSV